MTKRQYRQYEMLVRVRTFGNTHKDKFPEGSEGAKAFAAVTAALEEIDTLWNGNLLGRRRSTDERLAAKRALAARIGAIARSARARAKTEPGADAKFPRPKRESAIALLHSAHVFLEEVEPMKETFVRCGLPDTFVQDLQQAIATLEQTVAGRAAGKAGAVVAQKGIRATLRQAIEMVATLDVFVANTLGTDTGALNSWKSDRHVELAGANASVGAPPENGVSLPASPADHPIPAAGDIPRASSADQPPVTTPVGDPLRRAS